MRDRRAAPSLRALAPHLRPHRRVLTAAFTLGIGYTAAILAIPLVVRTMIGAVEDGRAAALGPTVATLLLLIVGGGTLGFAQWLVLGRLAERIVLDARDTVVTRLLRATVPSLLRTTSGETVTRVASDTVLLREAATTGVVMVANSVVMLTGALVLMATLDLVLAAVLLAGFLVIVVSVAVVLPRLGLAHARAQSAVGSFGGVLAGAMGAVRTIKADRAEARTRERIVAHAQDAMVHRLTAVRGEAIAITAAGVGIQVAVVMVVSLGALRVAGGQIDVATLVAFILYAFQIAEPATTLVSSLGRLPAGAAAAARIADLEMLPGEGLEPEAPARGDQDQPPVRPDAIVRFEAVRVVYGAVPALADLDLEIPRVGHTVLVGPSGAGKSTAFNVLLGFVEPTAGTVSVDGQPMDVLGLRAVRERIAYIEQDAPLLPGTLRDNVRHRHPGATDADVLAALSAVGLASLATSLPLGLDTEVDGGRMSGGERARIALARVLLRPAPILLLDEPTSQLDGISESVIRRLMTELSRVCAVVTIAHRMATVLDADRVLLMESGRVRAAGPHDRLLSEDAGYRALIAGLGHTVPPARVAPGPALGLDGAHD